jgi:hypothetical protein
LGRQAAQDGLDLWTWLIVQDAATRLSLLAYCAARTVNAIRAPWTHEPKRLAQADTLAQVVGLDMADYWAPTVDLYLGRVTKARIVEAVRDGVSERDAESIAGLKRWLPSLLRTPEPVAVAHSECVEAEPIGRAAEWTGPLRRSRLARERISPARRQRAGDRSAKPHQNHRCCKRLSPTTSSGQLAIDERTFSGSIGTSWRLPKADCRADLRLRSVLGPLGEAAS